MLMVVNMSPAAASTSESISSLRFAKVVNGTDVGTARQNSGGVA